LGGKGVADAIGTGDADIGAGDDTDAADDAELLADGDILTLCVGEMDMEAGEGLADGPVTARHNI
jgi:hypothetical protein